MEIEVKKELVIKLLNKLNEFSLSLVSGKKSTEEIDSDRLFWELFHKIFTIIDILKKSINNKDSLTTHLVVRYLYEIFIVSLYILCDEETRTVRVFDFLNFSKSKSPNSKWTKTTYQEMIDSINEDDWSKIHKELYPSLCNFAHPNMDSFLLNRCGEYAENEIILKTTLLGVYTITELISLIDRKSDYLEKYKNTLLKEIQAINIESFELMEL